ncbi:hypothetical protein F5Y14DRAFT_451022 [Nemania sp. NC0429]|nr:hypothetical protein F5Y14DRAFT_451022 [Nemania sp. NC0429]
MNNDSNTELEQLWREAAVDYLNKSKTGSTKEEPKFSVKSDADLDELISQHESAFSNFRGHRGRFWGVFKTTVTHLQRLGDVVQAGVGLTPFAPASIIVEAALVLVKCGSDVADTYDSLEDLFKRIRDITDRLDEYLKGSIDHKLRKVAVSLLRCVLDVFCEAQAAIKRGRGREMMRRVAAKENGVQNALDKLDETVARELALITAKTYSTVRRIDGRAEVEQDRELLRQALHTDAISDNKIFHAGVETSRLPKSGDWLLDDKLFGDWIRMKFPVLWILGRPGTGKTYLASRVISYLRQNPTSTVAGFFYIREGMNTQHTPGVILKTIARQVTELHNPYRKRAVAACKDDENLLSPGSIWDNLFVKPFKDDTVASSPLFIVIDGVDEATKDNQRLLVELAKRLSDLRANKRALPAIQLLLLGRPELEYDVSNTADIERFVKRGVSESIPLLQKMRPDSSRRLKREILATIRDKSDGMFMMAKLMLAEIKDMNKPELIRKALAKPPVGLDDMFKRVITRLTAIGGFDKDDLNEIIMWISCAKRDLLLGELDLILKLRDLRQNGIVALDDELRTRFGSFFSISNAEDEVDDDPDDDPDDVSVATGDPEAELVTSTSEETSDTEAQFDADSDYWSDTDGDGEDQEAKTEDGGDGDIEEYIDEDDSNEDVVPSKFSVATVKFGHASVSQHFRTGLFHEGIGMDVKYAQTHIAMTCIQFLNGNIPRKRQRPWRQPDLLQYAADHVLSHLAEIDLEDFRNPGKLVDEIVLLFENRSSLQQWFKHVSDEQRFISQLFSQGIRSRLRECVSKREAEGSPELLLRYFAQAIAEAWLLSGSCDGILAILFLRVYMSTQSDGDQWTLPPNRSFQNIAETISPDEIRQLASLGALEESNKLHSSLGHTLVIMKTRTHILAAIEEFRKAIQGSEDPEVKMYLRCKETQGLFALGEYEEVITSASQAIETLPANNTMNRAFLTEIMQNANMQLGNQAAALEAASLVWKLSPSSIKAAINMLWVAYRTGSFPRAVETITALLNEPQWGPKFIGQIICEWRYAGEYISSCCIEVGRRSLAEDIFTTVSRAAADSGDGAMSALAGAALAHHYYQCYQDDKGPIIVWEGVVRDHPYTLGALHASFALAPLYFTMAADPATKDADLWSSKLEELVKQWVSRTDVIRKELDMPVEYLSALLGRWHAQRGETHLARAEVLPLMKMAIRDLTDKIDSNDHAGFAELGRALLCFGDRDNAEIAYAFTVPLRKSKELLEIEGSANNSAQPVECTPPRKGSDEPDEPFQFIPVCDGIKCGRRKVDYRSFSICEICIDIGFCDECLQHMRENKLPFRICDSKHPFFQAYPPTGRVTKERGVYMVHMNDQQVVSADVWLGNISRDWLGTFTAAT